MTLDGRALADTWWMSPAGTYTLTVDVSASDDPDISGRGLAAWFQPRTLGTPEVAESLVTMTPDTSDAATGVVRWSFDAGALWDAVGSATVRALVVDSDGLPWWSLLVVLDLDGTKAQSSITLPAVTGGELRLSGTLHLYGGGSGPGGGAVDSVNGQTGVVVLDADDVGAATAAQGALADTSVQPGDLGTAAGLDVGTTAGTVAAGDDSRFGSGDMLAANNLSDVADAATSRTNLGLGTAALDDTGDFATAAQGGLADTATQPGDLGSVATSNDYDHLSNKPTFGTAAAADTGDFATAAQGTLAGTATQPGDLGGAAALDVGVGSGGVAAGNAPFTITANTQTGDYTLALSDAGKVIEMNKATAVTLTVPANATVAFSLGTIIEVYAMGAGTVTVAAAGSVDVRNAGDLSAQYATASLRKRATDEWVLTGSLA